MKIITAFFIIIISFAAYSQSKTYYDADWKETIKEKASYYREQPKKEKDVWLIKDYYIGGEKQFVGQATDSLATIFEGDVTWYFKTGKVQSKIRYKNGKQIANGSFKNETPFRGTFLYESSCGFHKIQQYENGNKLKEITYNKEDEKIGEISFKNEMPNTGVYINCYSLETYENGKLHGKSIRYTFDEDQGKESEFIFKNGLKHGNYTIYQDKSLLLEKGKYKKGVQIGEVLYFYNGVGEELNYYLKANVKLNKNKPTISEISQFKLDDKGLLQTFKLEKNNTDKFTYINNGYHSISTKDINSDGFDDLQITYYHHLYDTSAYTYYVFNSETNKYKHLAELDNANNIDINSTKKTIKATFRNRFNTQIIYSTYGFIKYKLIKKN